VQPEDVGAGATRGLIKGDAGEARSRGNPNPQAPAPLKDARVGATRNSIAGQPETAGAGATRNRIGKLNGRSMVRFIRSSAEDAKFESSRRVIIDPAADAGTGVTRRRIGGTAGGYGIRGNPDTHHWRSRGR